jgi:hypothetical protein
MVSLLRMRHMVTLDQCGVLRHAANIESQHSCKHGVLCILQEMMSKQSNHSRVKRNNFFSKVRLTSNSSVIFFETKQLFIVLSLDMRNPQINLRDTILMNISSLVYRRFQVLVQSLLPYTGCNFPLFIPSSFRNFIKHIASVYPNKPTDNLIQPYVEQVNVV